MASRLAGAPGFPATLVKNPGFTGVSHNCFRGKIEAFCSKILYQLDVCASRLRPQPSPSLGEQCSPTATHYRSVTSAGMTTFWIDRWANCDRRFHSAPQSRALVARCSPSSVPIPSPVLAAQPSPRRGRLGRCSCRWSLHSAATVGTLPSYAAMLGALFRYR